MLIEAFCIRDLEEYSTFPPPFKKPCIYWHLPDSGLFLKSKGVALHGQVGRQQALSAGESE